MTEQKMSKYTLNLQYFGGRGAQSGGGSGGGSSNASSQQAQTANTPSGISYQQFMAMTPQERMDTAADIIAASNIQVPAYMDGSTTSKLIYGLGMNNKPTVVDDATLDTLPGREIYRTVYQSGTMPPPTSDAVLDQIRNGDYTQMSGSGGSAHSRAIYFATDFNDSASYGQGWQNAMVMRAKISQNANIRSESSLRAQMQSDTQYAQSKLGQRMGTSTFGNRDALSVYAITQGVDGWWSGTYTMMVNRGVLTASSQNKRIGRRNTSGATNALAGSWQAAAKAR